MPTSDRPLFTEDTWPRMRVARAVPEEFTHTETLWLSTEGPSKWNSARASLCWLLATLGIHLFQVRLLSSLYAVSPHASMVAAGSVAWMLGNVSGGLLPRSVRWEGVMLLTGIFVFFVNVSFRLPITVDILGAWLALALLGMACAGWLTRARRWSVVRSAQLAEHSWTLIVSLALVWMLPTQVSIVVAFVCLTPLLLLDAWQSSPSRLETPAIVPTVGVHRSALRLRLLACLFGGIQAALWNAVLVPFAASLWRTQQLSLLPWLVAGAGAAWGIWCVGEQVLAFWQSRPVMPLVAVGMVTGGLLAFTVVHTPLLLAICMASLTLGNLLWGWALPAAIAPGGSEKDAMGNLEQLSTGLAIGLSVPLGLFIDRFSIDSMLILVCAGWSLLLLCTAWDMLISWLVSRYEGSASFSTDRLPPVFMRGNRR